MGVDAHHELVIQTPIHSAWVHFGECTTCMEHWSQGCGRWAIFLQIFWATNLLDTTGVGSYAHQP